MLDLSEIRMIIGEASGLMAGDRVFDSTRAEELVQVIAKEFERLNMQLIACSSAALGIDGPALECGHRFWTPAYQDVRRLRHAFDSRSTPTDVA